MYESFFGLHQPAFSITPDPRFLWPSEGHREGLAALCYGISRRKGFILLTGEVGTGKTTLLRAALEKLPEDILDVPEVATINNTAELSSLDLFKLIAAEFRIAGPQARMRRTPETTADYLVALSEFLRDRFRSGLNTVLVIDEAQNLSLAVLEQVRLLGNLETRTHKLLQVVLAGQPELRAKLADSRLRPLAQRIAVEHRLEPLPSADILAYLRHRVHVGGGRYERVFAPGVEEIFASFSRGCPRLVNQLADRALLAGYARGVRPVVPALVELKARQLMEAELGIEPPRRHRRR